MPPHNRRPGIFAGLDASFRRGIRWSMAGTAGSAVFQLLQMVVFARLAAPAEAGDYALAAAMVGFLTPLAEAGVSQAIVYVREIKPAQLTALIWVNWAIGAVIFVLLYVAAPIIASWYSRPAVAGLLVLMSTSC
ncbi:MAG: oligosaccharide flippase family protein [Lewinellaceae bacterium]|nr:oligosaccharide flippase family protein [Lewinellaceae bacterium]